MSLAVASDAGSDIFVESETSDRVSDELLQLAYFAAHRAGESLLRRRGNITGLHSKSTENDWVSDADTDAEAIIGRAIQLARHEDGQIGEEGTSRVGASGYSWSFDPLDGTVNYLYGSDVWCVSIACADEVGTLIGVVYEPVAGKTYWAIRDRGSFLNGVRLQGRDATSISRSLISFGFSYDEKLRARQGELAAYLSPRARDLRRNGSAALSLCNVASGEVDVYMESPINLWDISAASLIAAETGSVISMGPFSDQLSVLACRPALHEEITSIVSATENGRYLFPHLSTTAPAHT